MPKNGDLDRLQDVMHGLRILYSKESGRVRLPSKNIDTSLYVIECAGFVKIGISVSVKARLKHLQASNPIPLVIARVYGRAQHGGTIQSAERRLHKLFKKHHVRSEWFDRQAFIEMQEFEK